MVYSETESGRKNASINGVGKIHINLDCFRLLQIFINSTFVFRRCGGTDWFGLRENKFVVAVFPLFESILGKQEHLGSV